MSASASKAMRVVDRWDPEFPHVHHLEINRKFELTRELNIQLAIIANGKRHVCKVTEAKSGHTTLRVIITLKDDPRHDINKLRDVIYQLADTIGYKKGQRILVDLEGRMEPIWLEYGDDSAKELKSDLAAAKETDTERRKRLARERNQRHYEATRRLQPQRASA